MALFPRKTPDEIVFGVFLILAGYFFLEIFEFSPWLIKHAPKGALAAGTVLLMYGIGRLITGRGRTTGDDIQKKES